MFYVVWKPLRLISFRDAVLQRQSSVLKRTQWTKTTCMHSKHWQTITAKESMNYTLRWCATVIQPITNNLLYQLNDGLIPSRLSQSPVWLGTHTVDKADQSGLLCNGWSLVSTPDKWSDWFVILNDIDPSILNNSTLDSVHFVGFCLLRLCFPTVAYLCLHSSNNSF